MPTYKTDEAGFFKIPTRGKVSSIIMKPLCDLSVVLMVVAMSDTHVTVRAIRTHRWFGRWGKPRPFRNREITMQFHAIMEAS